MKPAPREDFFDVLLDRLVKDVASDLARRFNLEPADSRSDTQASDRARAMEIDATDLAARVMDWRVRRQGPAERPALQSPRLAQMEIADLHASAAERAQHDEAQATQDPWIALRSARALLALRILERDGLAFTANERVVHETHVSVQLRALRRERRRVLMHLHPDRRQAETTNELERRRIHERFLAAHEAFVSLFAELDDLTQSHGAHAQAGPSKNPGRSSQAA
ncbi:MAG TPA: hypothetical protein PLZ57_14040 [Pseudobdellovibrionaceae bacterium]|nr:hypothetical protein [Pseudobdellovibrionaceae bacterium]